MYNNKCCSNTQRESKFFPTYVFATECLLLGDRDVGTSEYIYEPIIIYARKKLA